MVHRQTRLTGWNRVVIALVALFAAVAISRPWQVSPVKAAWYNCSSHCGATWYWPGSNYGTFTELSTAELHCNDAQCWQQAHGQVGFIANVEWSYDTNGHNGACSDSASGGVDDCWIEAGYSTANTFADSFEYYYWADNRPGQNCIVCSGSYNEHFRGQISSSDYGLNHFYNISRVQGTTDTWTVYGPTFYEQSTSNPINPNRIYIGTELYGPNSYGLGAYGGYADWTNTEWVDSSSNYHYQGCGNPGAGLVSTNGAPPPYVRTIVSPCNSSTGGDIQTWCCNSSGPGYSPILGTANSTPSVTSSATDSGIPAIAPKTASVDASTPAFGAADIARYVSSSGIPHVLAQGQPAVAHVHFVTSQVASSMLAGEPTGLPNGTLVSVVELHGAFTFPNLLTMGKGNQVFEVFDAHTGNLLMVSVIH